MVVTSQGHAIEFVAKGQDLVFYINDDDGSPLSTKAMRGRATVQDDGKTTDRAARACCSEHDDRQVAGTARLKSARRVLG